MAAGDFQIAQLPDVKVKLDNLMTAHRARANVQGWFETFRAIAENQKIQTAPILVNGDCRGYKAWWKKPDCADPAITQGNLATDLCDFDADETIDLDEVTVDVTDLLEDKFLVEGDICEGANQIKFADRFAMELFDVFRRYEKKMDKVAIAFLDANFQDNTHDPGKVNNEAGVGTEVLTTDFNAAFMANMQEIALMNQINDPVFLNGLNLWQEVWNAEKGKCCTDESNRSKLMSFPNWYWDPYQLDQVLGEKASFLWDAGALAVINESVNESPVPVEVTSDKHIYYINHPTLKWFNNGRLEPMKIDVTRIKKCRTAANGKLVADYYWHFRLRYEFLKSPVGCNGLGLFKFLNVTAYTV